MNGDPLVSIIMPVHQVEGFVGAAVASVLAQGERRWELLAVDDGSTDGSAAEFAAAAGDELGRRVHLERVAVAEGPARARNRAIARSRGRWLAFLDADDLWDADRLAAGLAAAEATGAALVYSAYRIIAEDGRPTGHVEVPPPSVSYASLLLSNPVNCSTALLDTAQAGRLAMPDIRKRQDLALWLVVTRNGGSSHGIMRPLASYRLRAGSVSANKLSAAAWQWRLYREVERLPLPVAAWCFCRYALTGALKHLRFRLGRNTDGGARG